MEQKHERYEGPGQCPYCHGHKRFRKAGTRDKTNPCAECGGKGFILDKSNPPPAKKAPQKRKKAKTRAEAKAAEPVA